MSYSVRERLKLKQEALRKQRESGTGTGTTATTTAPATAPATVSGITTIVVTK
jgi:hypothetical protein